MATAFPLPRLGAFDKATFGRDVAASFVVFLVALPLCLGIAIASGVPAELGLITGIVGGIVVGTLAGSPLQVSGPAAGLAVLVFDLVQRHGLAALGPVLLLAGAVQLVAGVAKLGQWFRAVSPAVVHGMLAGIGALIVVQQAHVLIDGKPLNGGLANMAAIPGAFLGVGDDSSLALLVGVVTIAFMVGWEKFKPQALRLVPGALVGVLAGTALATAGGFAIKRIELPENIMGSIGLAGVSNIGMLADPALIGIALALAFIASAETLLSAAAVDRMQDRARTQYNKELGAQGIGNMICGLFGAMPMTGVIVRSSANVQAGAMTRASAILHGVWLLAFVALLPALLAIVPTAALAGVLVVTGVKLVKLKAVQELFTRYGTLPALVWVATFTLVVTVDLLTGVVVGLALAMLELLPHIRRLKLDVRRPSEDRLELDGTATAVSVPRLAETLDALPRGGTLAVDVSRLAYFDHTVSELLTDALKRAKQAGTDVRVEGSSTRQHRQLAEALA